MTSPGRKPARVPGLRERTRSDGTIRVWWEPTPQARAAGWRAVELDANRMSWSRGEAMRLNSDVAKALSGDAGRSADRRTGHLLADLIVAYRKTPHYTHSLAEATRVSYGKLLTIIATKWGTHPVAAFDSAVIDAWYETLFHARGARQAQALIRQMSILFELAERKTWRPKNSNPAARPKMVTPPPRSRAADWAELDALAAAAQRLGLPGMALAIMIAVCQGQRQADLRLAKRGDFRLLPILHPGEAEARPTWVWRFTRSKRRNDALVVVHDEVIPLLRAALADAGTADAPLTAEDVLIRDPATGQGYSADLFRKRWSAVRAEACRAALAAGGQPTMADLQFLDLRRTFGVLGRAGGASRDDLGDVLGNSAAVNPLLGETYMPPSFHTASRAVQAVQRPKATTEGRKKA